MIVIENFIGSHINRAITAAIATAWTAGDLVQFEFNGVTVQVRSDSEPDLIYRDWSRAMSGYTGKAVGPYPKPKLTRAEKASDTRIEAENARRRQAAAAEYEAKQAAEAAATAARLATAPALDLAHPDRWQASVAANNDPYGSGVIRYAEAWGRLMQVEIAGGAALEDVADETSHAADTEGITGFMYGAAVANLAACWVHGDQLRKWHNRRYGVGDDRQGTVNPAILTVGPRD